MGRNPSSTFRVNATFSITGRGLVLAGELLSGTVSVGDEFELDERWFRLSGVEMIRKVSEPTDEIGLVVPVLDDESKSVFAENLLAGTIIDFYSAEVSRNT